MNAYFFYLLNMKKLNILILLIAFISYFGCTSTTNKNEITKEGVLTKEEQLKKLYNNTVIPLFNKYKDVTIPSSFKIDSTDIYINAGAAFNYLEVSQGLVNYPKQYIQIYVLAHEVAHIVTLKQAKTFNLSEAIPSGKQTNDFKKSEYLADLIAIYLLQTQLPEQMDALYKNIHVLNTILGGETYTHPSNKDRIKILKTYITESNKSTPSITFKKFFIQIWKME